MYANTHDEKIYAVLSRRIRDRYDLFGSLPDTIEDEWIQDIENLDEYLSQFTEKKRRANAFDLRYGQTVMPEGPAGNSAKSSGSPGRNRTSLRGLVSPNSH